MNATKNATANATAAAPPPPVLEKKEEAPPPKAAEPEKPMEKPEVIKNPEPAKEIIGGGKEPPAPKGKPSEEDILKKEKEDWEMR